MSATPPELVNTMVSQQWPTAVVAGVVVVVLAVVVSGSAVVLSVVVGLCVVGGALLPQPTQMATTGS